MQRLPALINTEVSLEYYIGYIGIVPMWKFYFTTENLTANRVSVSINFNLNSNLLYLHAGDCIP